MRLAIINNASKMKLNFKNIPKWCINLKRNPVRKIEVSKEFSHHGIEVEFFEAVDKRDIQVPETSVKSKEATASGILACAMSHIAVIKMAKEKKLPAICIFEDDVVFCDDFKSRIKYLEKIQVDFDIFCLGGHYPGRNDWHIHHASKTDFDHVYKVKEMGGTYAYILTEKTYDFILRNWNFNWGMDEFYSNFVYRQFNTYAMTPFCCGHAKSKSDITEIMDWQYENVGWFFNKSIPLALGV